MSNRHIAAEIVLGEAAIKAHVGGLLTKVGLGDRVHAVVYAYETGIIQPGRAADYLRSPSSVKEAPP